MRNTTIKVPGMEDYFTQEAFNVLRTNIQFCGRDVKAITVTGCGTNEGKTVISLHLGMSLAELGKKVLVIDADMRKSVMAGRNAKTKRTEGLSEVLTGQQKLTDCIYSTQIPDLHVLFAGTYPPNPVELLNGKYFETVMDAVKQVYDYIIVDTPPLGIVIDAAVVAASCDSSVLVIGNQHTKTSTAKEVVEQLEKSGSKVLGVIMNNAENKNRRYYHKKNKEYGYYY